MRKLDMFGLKMDPTLMTMIKLMITKSRILSSNSKHQKYMSMTLNWEFEPLRLKVTQAMTQMKTIQMKT